METKSYNQIFQERVTLVETCLTWTTGKWIMIHIDYWPHLLGSLRMCVCSLLPATAAERITRATVYGKLNSRVCVCVYVCLGDFEASVPLVMLTQQLQLLLL